jgi:hypothetical protein
MKAFADTGNRKECCGRNTPRSAPTIDAALHLRAAARQAICHGRRNLSLRKAETF